MLEKLSWLHISDLHLRAGASSWGQDVVLKAISDDLASRQGELPKIEFLLVTGDIAFSGKREEYEQASAFLDTISRCLSLSRARVFCVPGNHDVDRSVQTTCFAGARYLLRDEIAVDRFLGTPLERETLLARQSAYHSFEKEFGSDSEFTESRLAYVAHLSIDHFPICIVGLNSAWLCDGGDTDDHKVVLGERQVLEAVKKLTSHNPKLVLALAHHPLSWLTDFDRVPIEARLIQACHIFHRGHLHVLEIKNIADSTGNCLTVSAGATFETRESEVAPLV